MTNLVKCRFQVSRYGVGPKSLHLYQASRWYVGCQYAGSHPVQQVCRIWGSFTSFILMFTLHAVLYFKMDPLYNYKIITRNIFCQSTPPSKYFYCIQCVRETERSPKQTIAEWRRPAGIIKPNIIQFHSSAEPPESTKVNTIKEFTTVSHQSVSSVRAETFLFMTFSPAQKTWLGIWQALNLC